MNLWWEKENWQTELADSMKKHSTTELKPFVLKAVQRNTMNCYNCSFEENCSGCIVPPGEEALVDFFARSNLIIEWHSSLIEEDYNPSSNFVIEHKEKEIEENY